ncbi:NUDIX hydrolase [Halobacteriales archaeon Cl-PHB]
MDVVDPRTEYDDLAEAREEGTVDAARFATFRDSEVFTAGWAAGGVVFDDRGRLLLIRNTDGVWLLPGGSVKPDESLAAAMVREVHEETGVDVEPRRPIGIRETVARHDGQSLSYRFVAVAATATSTAIADQLGHEDEPIAEATWVDRLPEPLYQPAFYDRLLARTPDWQG